MKIMAQQNDTVDLICHRVFGKTNGVVEEVIQLNPHISKLGPILTMGTWITLPDSAPITQEIKMINLWD